MTIVSTTCDLLALVVSYADDKARTENLPAAFAVWLCSAEADFLKGRFLWAQWDVEELKAKKAKIEADSNVLKIGLLLDGLQE